MQCTNCHTAVKCLRLVPMCGCPINPDSCPNIDFSLFEPKIGTPVTGYPCFGKRLHQF